MARIKTVTAKLGNMRKPQEFVVYPRKDGELVKVQSDKSIGVFDPETGVGRLCTKGSYGPDLVLNGQPYTFPADFVASALDATPKSGDQIGAGVFIA
jgi:hypothetical protein